MTVERGVDWGISGELPGDAPVARSDREASLVLEQARRDGQPRPVIGLVGGDLCRTLGGTGDVERMRRGPAMLLPCDVGVALIEGRVHYFVAHLVVRASWWRGPVVAAMNAEWLGTWDAAPRAHPGDGTLDVVEVDRSMPLLQRGQAWRRLPSGTHVPHPLIEVRRTKALQLELERAQQVYVDGVAAGRARRLSIRIDSEPLTVVV